MHDQSWGMFVCNVACPRPSQKLNSLMSDNAAQTNIGKTQLKRFELDRGCEMTGISATLSCPTNYVRCVGSSVAAIMGGE